MIKCYLSNNVNFSKIRNLRICQNRYWWKKWHKIKFATYEPNVVKKNIYFNENVRLCYAIFCIFFICFFNWNVIISVFTPPLFLPYLLCSIKSIIFQGQRKELIFYIERGRSGRSLFYLFKINNICRGKKLELMVLKEVSFCHKLKFSNPLFISLKPDGVNL